MTASTTKALIALALFTATRGVAAQASVDGSVFDSLSARAPLANATIVLVERTRYTTTDAHGRFRFDSLPAGRYTLGLLHPVLDSFDLALPPVSIDAVAGSRVHVDLAIPSAATAYSNGCRHRPAQVADKASLVAYLRVARECRVLARRAAAQSDSGGRAASSNVSGEREPQFLAGVTITDTLRSMSLMAIDGFYERRKHGLGKFLTDSDLKRLPTQRLAEMFGSVPGIHVEYGTHGQPEIFMIGMGAGWSPYCSPTYFVDGMPYDVAANSGGGVSGGVSGGGGRAAVAPGGGGGAALSSPFADLSLMIRPEMITGLEVYETSGVIPAQYDRTSSTGCGSIVIWTR